MLVAACGANNHGPVHVAAPPQESGAQAFVEAERRILAEVAAVDARFEARTFAPASDADLRKAGMQLIFEEDTQAAVVGGRIDPFSFGARARALDRAASMVPVRALPARAAGDLDRPALERELLLRLLASESARAHDEASLPRGATELVRGLVSTWSAVGSPARDAWLARRLGELGASLGVATPSRAELDELDDALDPLEALLDANYTQSHAALAQLRVAIGAASPGPVAPWTAVAPALAREVGPMPATELAARLERAEIALRTSAIPPDATLARLEALATQRSRPCRLDPPASLVRALGAPPERDLACVLVRLAATGDPDLGPALHAVVAASLGAIALHGGPVTSPPPPRGTLHGTLMLERRGASRPVDAIVAGLAAAWLSRDPKPRATRWLAFGDAPLDVVWRELGP